MSRSFNRLILALVLIGALALAFWQLSRPQAISVVVAPVTRGLVEATVANTRAGTVEACRRARLAPIIAGQIAVLPVSEGATVAADDVLLELWNADLAAQLELALRQADAARARSEETCVNAAVAAREAQRFTRLRKQGLASEEDADRSVGEAKARAAACEASRAATRVSEVQIKVNQAALDRTILRAPFAGTVAEINGELGEVVTPSPIGIPTLPAVDLVDVSCLYVTAPIDEVDAPEITAGMPARISLDAFAKRRFTGTVRRVAPYVQDREKQARTVDIEVNFDDATQQPKLLPGYSADVEVVLDQRADVLRVPTEAVLEDNYVLVFDAASETLEKRVIETGLSNWEFTEVVSGVQAGEKIVTSVDREGVAAGARAKLENDESTDSADHTKP